MVVPFAALWAALLPAAGTPTGASRPAELLYGFLTVEFPPARALNASTPCLLTSTGPFPRICCDQDPLGSTPLFEPEITTSPVRSGDCARLAVVAGRADSARRTVDLEP